MGLNNLVTNTGRLAANLRAAAASVPGTISAGGGGGGGGSFDIGPLRREVRAVGDQLGTVRRELAARDSTTAIRRTMRREGR